MTFNFVGHIMKERAVIIGYIFLCLAGNASAGDEAYDFSGSWLMNEEKSEKTQRTMTGSSGMMVGGMISGSMMSGGIPMGGGGMLAGIINPMSDTAKDIPWDIDLRDKVLRINNSYRSVNGENTPNFETYLLDGKTRKEKITQGMGEVVKTTRASINKNKIKIEIKISPERGQKSSMKREFTLSKDGKSMKINTFRDFSFIVINEKEVFERQ